MTGTITGSQAFTPGGKVITLDWKSDASGDGLIDLSTELSLGLVTGLLAWIETAPGEDGDLTTDLPTASYDLYLLDIHGYDWLKGALVDRSGTVAELVEPSDAPILLNQRLILKVDNAGSAKRGRVILGLLNL